MSRRLASLGELELLRQILPGFRRGSGVRVGPGDDCAVVEATPKTLLTTDALVEGVHFERSWMSARDIGAKAVLVNLSDIAAMGGRPRYVLLSLGIPPALDRRAVVSLHRGAEATARAAGASIVGGNLSACDKLFVSVTLIGTAQRPLLRSGASSGDLVCVTGTLGDAALAVDLLSRGARAGWRSPPGTATVLRRFRRPTPRLATARTLAASGLVSSMIDVSDGLVRDLGHLCEAASKGAIIFEEKLPRSAAYLRLAGTDTGPALAGGEDYELLFTVSPAHRARFERIRRRLPAPVTVIGEIVARPRGVRVVDANGRARRPRRAGFEHFRQS